MTEEPDTTGKDGNPRCQNYICNSLATSLSMDTYDYVFGVAEAKSPGRFKLSGGDDSIFEVKPCILHRECCSLTEDVQGLMST